MSNYTTILTCSRYLNEKMGIDLDDIFISSNMFSLYGDPLNWFRPEKVVDSDDINCVDYDSIKHFDLSLWPTSSELNLKKYMNVFSFNSRVEKNLKKDKCDYSNCLGIHYRGTDTRNVVHTDFVHLDKMLKSLSKELYANEYDSVFICTDEEESILKIEKYIEKNHKDIKIRSFDHHRVDGHVGMHFTNFSKEDKILLGDQVILDSYTLSKCKCVIGRTSNLINYARILNPSLEVLYQDLNSKHKSGVMNNTFSQIRTSDIQPFIFNWRGQFDKTCKIEESLKKIFDEVLVINSDEKNTKPGWIDLGEEAYFTMQFTKALELFKDDKKVLMHCQGDTVYNDYAKLVNDAKIYYNSYEWGVYAPDVTNVWYTSEHTDIDGIQSQDENIKMVACTDETVWFVHRDIIDEYYSRGLSDIMTHERMKMGWGWDLVMNGISFLKGRPVIRDYAHQIQHAKGTNYDKVSAGEEMALLWDDLQDDLKECISYIKGDREKLIKYFS